MPIATRHLKSPFPRDLLGLSLQERFEQMAMNSGRKMSLEGYAVGDCPEHFATDQTLWRIWMTGRYQASGFRAF